MQTFDIDQVSLAIEERPQQAGCAVAVCILAGAAWELPDEEGCAHLLEHVVCGTPGPDGLSEPVMSAGGTFDAWTSHDAMQFRAWFPATAVSAVMPRFLHALCALDLHDETLQAEKVRVIHETTPGATDPAQQALRQLLDQRYRNHPYGRSVQGRVDAIGRVSTGTLRAFRNRMVRRPRMSVAVVGPVPASVVFGLVRDALADLDGGEPLPTVLPDAPRGMGITDSVVIAGDVAHLALGLALPTIRHPDLPALERLSSLLSEPRFGGLNAWRLSSQEVRETSAITHLSMAGGTLVIRAVTGSDRVDEARKGLVAVLTDMLRCGPSTDALDAARAEAITDLLVATETSSGRAALMAHGLGVVNDPDFAIHTLQRALALTPERLVEAWQRHLRDPEPGGSAAAESWPKKPTASLRHAAATLPGVTSLDAARIRLAGGVRHEVPATNGLHALLATCLAHELTAPASTGPSRDLARLGARVGMDVGWDGLDVWVDAPRERLIEAVGVVCEAWRHPRLDSAVLSYERERLLHRIRSRVGRPRALVQVELCAMAFAGHPYGLDPLGSPEALVTFGVDDLRAAAHRLWDQGVLAEPDAPMRRSDGGVIRIEGPFAGCHVGLLWRVPREAGATRALLDALGVALEAGDQDVPGLQVRVMPLEKGPCVMLDVAVHDGDWQATLSAIGHRISSLLDGGPAVHSALAKAILIAEARHLKAGEAVHERARRDCEAIPRGPEPDPQSVVAAGRAILAEPPFALLLQPCPPLPIRKR